MDSTKYATISWQDIHEFLQSHPEYVVCGGVAVSSVALYGLARWYFAGGRCTSQTKLNGKTAIITGANCGIGKETARDFAERSARVILACRDVSKGERAAADIRKTTGNGNVDVMQCDLSSLESIQKFCGEVLKREENIHILVNNAGVMVTNSDLKTVEGFEMQIGVNHLGHFLLTNLLLDRMKQSAPARIINVTSLAYKFVRMNFNDINMITDYNPFKAYGQSKLANVLFTQELARRLEGTGVMTYSVHPGAVHTDLGRNVGVTLAWWKKVLFYPFYFLFLLIVFKTSRQGAQTSIYCAVEEGIEDLSGRYFSDCEVQTLAPHAENEEDARRLWELSAHMVRLDS